MAALEGRTGVQVVTAIVRKSDSYTELPWKAFALGASLAGAALVLFDWLRPSWATGDTARLHVTILLAVAASSALAAIFLPPFARLFLRQARAEVEVRQYAQALFLEHALFATRQRTAILLLVSLFERRIEVLHDTGLAGRVSESEWASIIATMAPSLRDGRPFNALQSGLAGIGTLLAAKGFTGAAGSPNDLPDRPIEERGQ